jgi:hypothetical protein
MTIFGGTYNSLEEQHEATLQHYRVMFASGIQIAVPAAIYYCAIHGLNSPRWLIFEVAMMLFSHLRGDVPKERGRSAGIVNRFRQDFIDYARWNMVFIMRDRRDWVEKEIKTYRAISGGEARAMLKKLTEERNLLGTNNDDAFACASLALAKHRACGSPHAIKRSYLKVEKNMRNPATAARYHSMDDPEFLQLVGF